MASTNHEKFLQIYGWARYVAGWTFKAHFWVGGAKGSKEYNARESFVKNLIARIVAALLDATVTAESGKPTTLRSRIAYFYFEIQRVINTLSRPIARIEGKLDALIALVKRGELTDAQVDEIADETAKRVLEELREAGEDEAGPVAAAADLDGVSEDDVDLTEKEQ